MAQARDGAIRLSDLAGLYARSEAGFDVVRLFGFDVWMFARSTFVFLDEDDVSVN